MRTKHIVCLGLALCMAAGLTLPASAMSMTINAPGNPEYGKSTSIEPVYTADGGAQKNEDLSKNAALFPPGSDSSGSLVGSVGTPLVGGVSDTWLPDGACYQDSHIAVLTIPAIGLEVKVYEGVSDSALSKGVGHFPGTSVWGGNVCLAGHNRGVNSYFGQIHTLAPGAVITWSTGLGARAYRVVSVEKVSVNDTSGLAPSDADMLTLYTCVRNESNSRWKVVAAAL